MAKIRLLLFVFVALVSVRVGATAQHPDRLIYQGDTLPLFTNPLEQYFSESHPRPDSLFCIASSACWRGYIATWELRSDSLFLRSIQVSYDGLLGALHQASLVDLSSVIEGASAGGPVFAHWFSGTLYIPRGKMLEYVHMGYASLFEKELFLEIRGGRLVRTRVLDNTKTFTPFTSDKELMFLCEYLYRNLDSVQSEALEGKYFIIQRVSRHGRIRRVSVVDESVPRSIRRSFIKVVKSIPRYNVYYIHGKPQLRTSQSCRLPRRSAAYQSRFGSPSDYKQALARGEDSVYNLRQLVEYYEEQYDIAWKYLNDSLYRVYEPIYLAMANGDSTLLWTHGRRHAVDTALNYYYMLWDLTDEHLELYQSITKLEQQASLPHNPKVVEVDGPPFRCLFADHDLMPTCADSSQDFQAQVAVCNSQFSYALSALGEPSLRDSLPQGVMEEYRCLFHNHGHHDSDTVMLIVAKVCSDHVQLEWKMTTKPESFSAWPNRDHRTYALQDQGTRHLTPEEWQGLKTFVDNLDLDNLLPQNRFSRSATMRVLCEHRTRDRYHVLAAQHLSHLPQSPDWPAALSFVRRMQSLAH